VSGEDVELIRRVHEAWIAGDREAALAGIDPDIEWVEPPDSPDWTIYRGAEGIEASMAEWADSFEDFGFEVKEIRGVGEGLVLVCVHQHGRARGSTVPIEATLFHLWTIRDGRAVRAEMFRSEADALQAAKRPAKHA
jgi:ketosteroid isomerase-like protein